MIDNTVATLLACLALFALATPVAAQTPLLEIEAGDGSEVATVRTDSMRLRVPLNILSGGLRIGATSLVAKSTGAFLARGAYESSTTVDPLATGRGTRMLWYPEKAAFRAGYVGGTQWDRASTGYYSAAFGSGSTASGNGSVAAGFGTLASDQGAVAFGTSTVSSGDGSLAAGRRTTASGGYSIALGYETVATAQSSIALGWADTASAAYGATAIGAFSAAKGQSAMALGNHAKATGHYSFALGYYADTNQQSGSIVIADGSINRYVKAQTSNQLAARAKHFWLGSDENVTYNSGHLISTSTGAYLSTSGVWTDNSSRALKENFAPVDPERVLRTVEHLPVMRWNYKVDEAGIQHIGPVAEDFYAAFGLGADDEHIAPLDVGGVSLLSIQALAERTRELEAENATLEARVQRLEALVQRLAESQEQE